MSLKIKINKTCRKQCRYFAQNKRVISKRKLSIGTLVYKLYCICVIKLQFIMNMRKVFNFMTLNWCSLWKGSLRSNSALQRSWRFTSQRTATVIQYKIKIIRQFKMKRPQDFPSQTPCTFYIVFSRHLVQNFIRFWKPAWMETTTISLSNPFHRFTFLTVKTFLLKSSQNLSPFSLCLFSHAYAMHCWKYLVSSSW